MSLLIEIEITIEWENLRKITRWISWVYVRDMLKGFHFVVGAIHLLRDTISGLSGPPPPLCRSLSAFGLPPPMVS